MVVLFIQHCNLYGFLSNTIQALKDWGGKKTLETIRVLLQPHWHKFAVQMRDALPLVEIMKPRSHQES